MFLRFGQKFGPIIDVAMIDGGLHVVVEVVSPPQYDGEVIVARVANLIPSAQREVEMWIETTRLPV